MSTLPNNQQTRLPKKADAKALQEEAFIKLCKPGLIGTCYYGWVWLEGEETPPSHKSFTLEVSEDDTHLRFVPKDGFTVQDVMQEIGFVVDSGRTRGIVMHAGQGKARVFWLNSRWYGAAHLIAVAGNLLRDGEKITLQFLHGEAGKMFVEAQLIDGTDYFSVTKSDISESSKVVRLSYLPTSDSPPCYDEEDL